MSVRIFGEALLRRFLARTELFGEAAWQRQVAAQLQDFCGAVWQEAPRADVRERQRLEASPRLPFDLYLALGSGSRRLFAAGPLDEFAFVERRGVSLHHDTEFLTRLDPGEEETENFSAYGVIRLYRDGSPVPTMEALLGFWRALERDYGLRAVPPAAAFFAPGEGAGVLPGEGAEAEGEAEGRPLRAAPPRSDRVFARAGLRRFFFGDLLEILRLRLSPFQKIVWLEESFAEALAPGEVVHRYYLTAAKQLYLVRHHWSRGKRLYPAEVSAEARRLCRESGAFQRLRERARRARAAP